MGICRSQYIDEVRGGRKAFLNEPDVSLHKWQDPVGARAIRLRFPPRVKPRTLRATVLQKGDVGVGEAIRVGIEVSVVIVGRKQHSVLLANINKATEFLQGAQLGIWRVKVRQAIVITPALPRVPNHHGVGEAVTKGAREACSAHGIAPTTPTPEVEYEAAGQFRDTAGCLEAVDVSPDLDGVPDFP